MTYNELFPPSVYMILHGAGDRVGTVGRPYIDLVEASLDLLVACEKISDGIAMWRWDGHWVQDVTELGLMTGRHDRARRGLIENAKPGPKRELGFRSLTISIGNFARDPGKVELGYIGAPTASNIEAARLVEAYLQGPQHDLLCIRTHRAFHLPAEKVTDWLVRGAHEPVRFASVA